uniref:Apple domain-containing protein n=1 Tax=Biomphalaria glabrata TaxID=6526 RepID=A0A2C9KDN6_BIOGL
MSGHVTTLALLMLFVAAGETSEYLKSFQNLFARMPQLQMTAMPSLVVVNFSSIEECSRDCVQQTSFDCRSFDVDNQRRVCLLYNSTHEDGKAFLRESSTTDHYRTAFEKLFNRLPNHVITTKHKKKIQDVSAEQCARRCIFEQDFRCAGFDYEPGYTNCWLTDLTVAQSEGVKFHPGADFYERDFGGALSNFISFGSGSLPYVEEHVMYSKSMFGLDLGACAQLCLTQTPFDCASFDYSFGDRSSQMSRYIASNVGGIDTDNMPTYRVMHYEKKGGALSNFISFGSGSLPYVEEHVMYSKSMFGLDLGACAQLCLTQTTFDCASFDYSFGDRSCQMSRYIASNVGGIDTDNMPTYRVMHYEKKGVSLDRFIATPYSIVPGENDKTLERVSPERCAQACLEEMTFVCRSFDYEIKESTCMLSKKTGSDIGKLFHQGLSQVHHFELKPSLVSIGNFHKMVANPLKANSLVYPV